MKQKIGIVICGQTDQRQFISSAYIQAIRAANGLPLVLPLVKSKEAIDSYTQLCDGFLFCGGADITPLLFGTEPERNLGQTDLALDVFQLRLMQSVLQSDKPILAICRGMQLLNVACGGTLFQDIDLMDGDTLNHMQTSISRKDISHKVTFTSQTQVYEIFGDFVYTNSFHHQAIDQLGDSLIACGHTADGIIEAIELPSHPFVIGVQWHAEHLYKTSDKMRQLFCRFVQGGKEKP